ncbi:c-type cytochrome, partial [Myxococcota bacterium]|nr:c-type cytochrome [Myxococcota bacterium]
FIARPEWYFLSLFQLLKYFQGPLQVVGTVVVPGLVAAFLALLPFLDRAPSRRFADRKPWLAAIGLLVTVQAGLTLLAVQHDANDPKIAEQKARAKKEADRAKLLAADGVPAAGAAYLLAHDPLTRGERVFERECASCHALAGKVPETPKGPELTAYGTRAWIRQVLRDPDSKRLFGHTKVEGMESFAALPAGELDQLVELVFQQRDEKAPPVAERPGAALLDKHDCTNCHEFESPDGLEGPTLFRYGARAWIRDVVDDAGAAHLYGDVNTMPVFKTRLSDEDRDAVVTFLLSLADTAPNGTWPFVDDPGPVPTPRPKKPAPAEPAPAPTDDAAPAPTEQPAPAE